MLPMLLLPMIVRCRRLLHLHLHLRLMRLRRAALGNGEDEHEGAAELFCGAKETGERGNGEQREQCAVERREHGLCRAQQR